MAGKQYLSSNGKIYGADKLLISPDNRSFRYGDGFFETIRMVNGKMPLWELHGDRLFRSLQKMHFRQPGHLTKNYFSLFGFLPEPFFSFLTFDF